jgi:NADH-quinone oxidoreductase subunit C
MSDQQPRGLDAIDEGPVPSDAAGPAPAGTPGDESGQPSVAALFGRFGTAILHHEISAGDEHVLHVEPSRNVEILGWLRDDPAQRYDLLRDVTGVDYGEGRPLQVVYELWSIPHRRALRVKCLLALDALEIDSVVPLWNTANWLEREVYDLFGVTFRGHPDLRRILMPPDYAEGHPLRKDFPLRGRFSRVEQTRRALVQDVERFYTPHDIEIGREPQQVTLTPPEPGDAPGSEP